MIQNLINLTPHDITTLGEFGAFTIPRSGVVARVETREEFVRIADIECECSLCGGYSCDDSMVCVNGLR